MTEYQCAVSKRRVGRGVEPKIRTNLFPPRISLRQNCYGQASNAGKTKSPSGQPPTRTIRLSHYLKEIDRSRLDNPGSPGWETEVLDKVAAKTDLLHAAELLQAIQFLKDTGAYSKALLLGLGGSAQSDNHCNLRIRERLRQDEIHLVPLWNKCQDQSSANHEHDGSYIETVIATLGQIGDHANNRGTKKSA